uniref:Uncharacterized protein n=1 Tax=Anopheles farauti TaxID=69004 RepID=A0A182PZC4_9DIPT
MIDVLRFYSRTSNRQAAGEVPREYTHEREHTDGGGSCVFLFCCALLRACKGRSLLGIRKQTRKSKNPVICPETPESITSLSRRVRDLRRTACRARHSNKECIESMTISAIPPPEPVWCLDRRDSGHLFWRRESSKVKFRYDVEVLEFTKDPYEDQLLITDSELNRAKHHHQAGVVSNMIVVCVTCVAAIAVTVVLPWFLIGSA